MADLGSVMGTVTLVALVAVGLAYGRGVERRVLPTLPAGAAALCALGLVAFAVGLVGPVERLAHESVAVHMIQHLLLGVVAPPLVLAGRPVAVIARTGSRPFQRRAARLRSRVLRLGDRWRLLVPLAVGSYAAVWWGWHVPALYLSSLSSDVVHLVEHATMIGAALLLWTPVVHPRRLPAWLGPLLLLGAAVQGGLLATLLTFSPAPWYGDLAGGFSGWAGLTPLEDQQLGGTLMWVVAGIVYLLAGAWSFTRWLRRDAELADRRTHPLHPAGRGVR